MTRIKTLAAAAVVAFGATSAFAQTGGDDPQHRDANSLYGRGALQAQAQREEADRGHAAPRGSYNERDSHGYEYGHHWRQGERLPSEYRSRSYVVDDWRGHHLRPPPAGYHWVQNGSDYLLVAIATGVIASIIANQ
jgi:Ni/Co efflux regulator RcnB